MQFNESHYISQRSRILIVLQSFIVIILFELPIVATLLLSLSCFTWLTV
jgi:hypothetical protein